MRGKGDIEITRTVNGKEKHGTLRKVLYKPELRRNLFSIGIAAKAGYTFQTNDGTCAIYRDFGRGPKVMEGLQIGTLYKLSIKSLTPIRTDQPI